MLVNMKLTEFADELAAKTSAPGGGSVSALSGAVSAGLISMVCRFSIGRKDSAQYDDELKSALDKTEAKRAELTELIDRDTEAFNQVMAAFKMPKETDEEKSSRSKAIQEGYKQAIQTPMQILTCCGKLLDIASDLVEKSNPNTMSDLGVAVETAYAGLQGGLMNVNINLSSIKDESFLDQTRKDAAAIVEKAAGVKADLDRIIEDKLK